MTYRYLSDVTTITLNAEKCTGCGRCADVCPHRLFAIEDHKARITDRDRCIECGACMKNCPFGAIDVKIGVGCAAAILGSKGGSASCGCGDGGGCC